LGFASIYTLMNDDMSLVREFAASQSDPAFATLVNRYIGLVHSAARRQVGDDHLAEEITQAVFIILARKAAALGPTTVLSAWLYRTTRYAVADAVKTRRRRAAREQEAYMQSILDEPDTGRAWTHLAPLLDDAMAGLGETDRAALVLRYFENKSAREIAAALKLEEATAQKRLTRALDKLRARLVKRGVTLTAAVIAGAISANAVLAAPAGLAMAVTTATAKGASISASLTTLVKGTMKTIMWAKLKIVIGSIFLFLVAGIGTLMLLADDNHPANLRSSESTTNLITNAQPDQQQVLDILKKVQAANEAAGTLTATFSYITKSPNGDKMDVRQEYGSIKLMKPNFADIQDSLGTGHGRRIISDGTTLWNYSPVTKLYTKTDADPEGKNVNLWRLIIIGGFFDVYTWIYRGIYVGDLSELSYAGVENLNGTNYQVLEHKMIGSLHGKACPFDQKVYVGPDFLIHRFTLDFTLDGKPGSEMAELTNIKTGQPMTPADFVFDLPPDAKEKTVAP